MKLTFLGSGAAGGVPLWGCECRACARARAQPQHRRQPNCAVLETGGSRPTRVLIDAGVMNLCDRFPPRSLAAILLTHFHADHVQGLFHWRWGVGEAIDVYAPPDPEGCADLYKYPGPLRFHALSSFVPFQVGGVRVTPAPLAHSKPTMGYCIEHDRRRAAYLTDAYALPPATLAFLQQWQPQLICLDCTFPPDTTGPRNHFDLTEALALKRAFPNSRLLLMHIGHRLDSYLMDHEHGLPEGVSVARDTDEILVG